MGGVVFLLLFSGLWFCLLPSAGRVGYVPPRGFMPRGISPPAPAPPHPCGCPPPTNNFHREAPSVSNFCSISVGVTTPVFCAQKHFVILRDWRLCFPVRKSYTQISGGLHFCRNPCGMWGFNFTTVGITPFFSSL